MSPWVRASLKIGLALFLVAALVAPAAGEPSVRHDEEAFADWFVPTETKNRFRWLGAYVSRSTTVVGGEWFSGAGFIKGWCTREKTPKYVSISCDSTDFVRADVNKDFEMSPLADTARLRAREQGRTYDVRWEGSPTSGGIYSYSEYCIWVSEEGESEEEGQGEGAGIFNPAGVRGNLFGYRFNSPRQSRWASLSTGVVATTCSFRTVEYDDVSETFHVTFNIPR